MTGTKIPSYLSVVNPAEWAFILLQRTLAAKLLIPQAARHHQEKLSLFVLYDDSHLWA